MSNRYNITAKEALKDPINAFEYALNVIGGRWPEAEPVIMQDAYAACEYACNILKCRWPEAEPVIMQKGYSAFCYARDIINDRWLEAEPYIAKDFHWHWLEVEPYIARDFHWRRKYCEYFNISKDELIREKDLKKGEMMNNTYEMTPVGREWCEKKTENIASPRPLSIRSKNALCSGGRWRIEAMV